MPNDQQLPCAGGRFFPPISADEPPVQLATVGPRAALVTLGAYGVATVLAHGYLRRSFLPEGLTNIVGAGGALVALGLFRAGKPRWAGRAMMTGILLDLLADLWLLPAAFDSTVVFFPLLIVGTCLLLGTLEAVVISTIFLLAVPLSIRWDEVAAGLIGRGELFSVGMAELSIIATATYAIITRRSMLRFTQQTNSLVGRLTSLLERAPDGIIVMGEDGCVTHANPSAHAALAPHALVPGAMLPSFLLRHDGQPADAAFLRGASQHLLRARVAQTERDLAITGAAIEVPQGGTYYELMIRDVSARLRERPPAKAAATLASDPTVPRLLIVDDDPSVLHLLTRLCQRRGWHATPCRGAAAALTLLSQTTVDLDLLLTDVRMPGIDGVELARRARALVPALPIVFMSGETGGRVDGLVLDGPAWHFLPKPFADAELHETVTRALGIGRGTGEASRSAT